MSRSESKRRLGIVRKRERSVFEGKRKCMLGRDSER